MDTKELKKAKKEAKKRERKEWINKKLNDTAYWIKENREFLSVVVPIGIAGISGTAKIVKGVSRHVALHKEQQLKDMYVYDRSLGKYLELKKPLTQSQMRDVLDRKEKGEGIGVILQSMNLLR